ncbi:MAG: ZIP family metal transporter [Crocinitomicaceae bacterium]
MSIEFQILILVCSVLIGGLLVEFLKRKDLLKLLLSFSGGYLLTIIFTHILPETYHEIGTDTGYYILGGFLLQLLLEYFSQGAEHGHTHLNEVNKAFPYVILLSLAIHSFVEAMPLTESHVGHNHEPDNLLWGIFLHKIPVAIALMTIFKAANLKRSTAWTGLGIFAITAPAGLIFGGFLMSQFNFNLSWVMAIAIGMFLHISTTIIFESNVGHKINLYKFIAILLGFGLGVILN